MSANGDPLLRLDAVDTFYGPIHILQGLTLEVYPGELVCLLGGNASGKSTTLKTVLGIVHPRNGSVRFGGEDVTKRSTSYRIRKGMAIVPENRRLFGPMTVLENLQMGAYLHGGGTKEDFERVYSLFPLLYERRSQLGGTLSGGEQQMVAMARAMMRPLSGGLTLKASSMLMDDVCPWEVGQTPQMRCVMCQASRGSLPCRMISNPRNSVPVVHASLTLPPSTSTSILRCPSILVNGSMVILAIIFYLRLFLWSCLMQQY